MTRKHPPQIAGNIGLFHTGYRLSQLGWNAMPTSRNARGIDVICFSMDGHEVLTFQVKSLSKRSAVPLGHDLDKLMGDFRIVVVNAASHNPECYVLLPEEVPAMADRNKRDGKVSYWLEPKEFAAVSFREKWERIVNGQPSADEIEPADIEDE